jgi:hypothetical protein
MTDLQQESIEEWNRRQELLAKNYHYEPINHDHPGEYFRFIGQFIGDWSADLYQEKERSVLEDWNETDQILISRLGKESKILPMFQKMIDTFQFARMITANIQTQKPGGTVIYHHDDFTSLITKNERPVRLIVFLEEWCPGQIFVFGNFTIDRWKKGDILYSDYEKVPHATANAGWNDRSILQITATASIQTTEIIAYGLNKVNI